MFLACMSQIKLVFSPLFGGGVSSPSAGGAVVGTSGLGRKAGGAMRGFCAAISVVWSYAIIGAAQLDYSTGHNQANPSTNVWVRMSYGFWESKNLAVPVFMSEHILTYVLRGLGFGVHLASCRPPLSRNRWNRRQAWNLFRTLCRYYYVGTHVFVSTVACDPPLAAPSPVLSHQQMDLLTRRSPATRW